MIIYLNTLEVLCNSIKYIISRPIPITSEPGCSLRKAKETGRLLVSSAAEEMESHQDKQGISLAFLKELLYGLNAELGLNKHTSLILCNDQRFVEHF